MKQKAPGNRGEIMQKGGKKMICIEKRYRVMIEGKIIMSFDTLKEAHDFLLEITGGNEHTDAGIMDALER